MKNSDLLGETPIPKLVMKLSIPAITAMLVNAVYNIVDTFFVGLLGDTGAIGAVTIAFPLFFIVAAIGQTFGVGGGAYISRLLGEGREGDAEKVLITATVTSIIMGIILSFIGIVFLKDVVRALGASPAIMVHGASYIKYITIGAPFAITGMALNNFIRAEGSTRYSMVAIVLGVSINMILDPLFMFGFKMGVSGAALATTLSQVFSTMFLFNYYWGEKGKLTFSLGRFQLSIWIYREILKVGLPSFIRQCLGGTALAFINGACIPYGDEAVAAFGIVCRVLSLGTFVLFGIAQAFQPIVAYNFGARNYRRVKEALFYTIKAATIFSLGLSVVFIFFAQPIVKIFSADPKVISMGVKILTGVMIVFTANGFQIVVTTLFQALGRAREAFILSVSRQGIFLAPCIIILPKIFDFYGVIYSQVVADFLTFVLTVFIFWKLKNEFNRELEGDVVTFREA